MIRLAILTSSRADFGIYLPLLRRIKSDPNIVYDIIAFGSHNSSFFGLSINEINKNGFKVKHKINTLLEGDTSFDISKSIGFAIQKFSLFWKKHSRAYDIVFALGDRYEMFSAVIAGVPFNIKFAHIHGGETTLGAIDNIFRHSITLSSKYHFTSLEIYRQRVIQILDQKNPLVFNVGALSLDNLNDFVPLTPEKFESIWGIDLLGRFILVTFHPETINLEKNGSFALVLSKIIKAFSEFNFIVNLPNADSNASVIREVFDSELKTLPNVRMVENFGTESYFTAMKYCMFLLGNSSSGIIEAASFKKYVINLGSRQEGRVHGGNVIDIPFEEKVIRTTIRRIVKFKDWEGGNIYDLNLNAAENILTQLKK